MIHLMSHAQYTWSSFFFTFGGRVEHFQKVKQHCHTSVIIMISSIHNIEALLLLSGALNSGGVGPPQQPLRHWKFSSCKWVCRGSLRRRSRCGRSLSWPGSHLSWCADNRCETSPPFCGSLLGATTGLFVLIFNVFVIFQRSSDFMISVTYFALVNLAMSKVDVHQDQGDQYEDGQGQVRIVMLYFNVLSQRLFKWKTVVTNCCLQFH